MFTNRYICTAIAVHGLLLAVATFLNKKKQSVLVLSISFRRFLVPADLVIGEKWYLFILIFFRFEDFMFQTDLVIGNGEDLSIYHLFRLGITGTILIQQNQLVTSTKNLKRLLDSLQVSDIGTGQKITRK